MEPSKSLKSGLRTIWYSVLELSNIMSTKTTDIQERKIELIQWLSVIEDATLLQKIFDLKDQSAGDWWDDLSADEITSIKKGLADAEQGNLRPHSEAQDIYQKWL